MNCQNVLSHVIFLMLFFVMSFQIQAQNIEFDKTVLRSQIDSALQFVVDSQFQKTIPNKEYAGEWPVDMHLTGGYVFLGKKQKAKDSNCFTVSSIHNALAEVYLLDTTRKELLPTLKRAFEEISTYEEDKLFNFWKKLPPNRWLKLLNEPSPQPLVHRPTNFRLKSRFINNAGNVPNDADDTSLGNLSAFYANRIFGYQNTLASFSRFDDFLDLNRKNRNWFNYLFHNDANSGAYMTWLHPEYEYNHWDPIKTTINTLFIFLPGSTAYPEPYVSWVPFGANDVDVVVNANVLIYLAKTRQLEESRGSENAIKLIEKRLHKKFWFNNSVYYPNQFHIHFAVAKAFASGVEGLRKTSELILTDILKKQNIDGSFQSQIFINNSDKVQSTVNALSAMIDCKKMGMFVPDSCMHKAIKYILSQRKISKNGMYLDAGVYFSGGTLLRNVLFWKSDAYTTAAVANCFQRYLMLL